METTTSLQVNAPVPSASSNKDRRQSCSSVDSIKKGGPRSTGSSPSDGVTQDVLLSKEEDDHADGPIASTVAPRPGKIGTIALPLMAIVILGWWVSSLVLPATRHRW